MKRSVKNISNKKLRSKKTKSLKKKRVTKKKGGMICATSLSYETLEQLGYDPYIEGAGKKAITEEIEKFKDCMTYKNMLNNVIKKAGEALNKSVNNPPAKLVKETAEHLSMELIRKNLKHKPPPPPPPM